MTVEVLVTITAALTALAALGIPLAKIWTSVAPYMRRRELPIVVVYTADHEKAAAAFAGSLRSAGYRAVERTRLTSAITASARAIILWEPPPDLAGELIEGSRWVAPEAEVLVFSTERLAIKPGSALISNSPLRLRGDLASVAEGAM